MANRKPFKIAGIILGILLALYIIALLIVSSVVNSNKVKILAAINNALRENLQGNATIKDLEISVWHHFPSVEVSLKGVSITDTLYHKPLLAAGSVSTTVGIFQMIGKHKRINDIIIKDGVFHLFSDSTGYNNNYLLQLKKRPDTAAVKKETEGSVEIRKVVIENVQVIIEDVLKNKKHELLVESLEANLYKKDTVTEIEMEEKIMMQGGLGFKLEKGAYLQNQSLEGKWKLKMNTATKVLTYSTPLNINKHPYNLSGHFNFSNDPGFKVEIHADDVPYANALKIVTEAIRKKISLVQLTQPLKVDGIIEGSLLPDHEPYVNISWSTKNNTVQTPSLSFSKSDFSGNFMNEVNKDSARNDANSRVILYQFAGDWDGIQFSGKNITINNLEHANINFDLQSSCSFDALDRRLALNTIKFIKGTADVHLKYNGPLTADNSMFESVEGFMHVRDGEIQYVPRNFSFTNCNGDIGFFTDSISVNKFKCDYKTNHFEVEVNGKNVRRKFVTGDNSEASVITCSVFSPGINLEDFNPLFEKEKTQTLRKAPKVKFSKTAGSIDSMLINGTMHVNVKANAIKYSHLDASNFNADIFFRPKLWEIAGLSFNLADGKLTAKGNMKKNNSAYHEASLKAKLENMNVQKLFYAFDDFGQKGVTSKNLRGIFNTDVNMNVGINSSGTLMPSTMNGVVNFSLKNGALVNFAPLMNMDVFVLKNKNMSNIKFAELKDKLEIDGNKVHINRMEIQSTALTMFVEGVYGLKGKDTELLMQLPLSNLEERDKTYTPKNIGVDGKVGPSVLVRAVSDDDGKIKFKLTLSKKVKSWKKESK